MNVRKRSSRRRQSRPDRQRKHHSREYVRAEQVLPQDAIRASLQDGQALASDRKDQVFIYTYTTYKSGD